MADYISKWLGQEIDDAVGQVLNKEIGEVVYVPEAILNLSFTSSSSEIAAAWGGEEYFKTICKRIVNNSYPIIGSKRDAENLINTRTVPINFAADYNETSNVYNIDLHIILYNQINNANWIYKFIFNNGTFELRKDTLLSSYPNEIVIPKAVLSLTNQSTSQEILNAWGVLLNLQQAAFRAHQKNAILTVEGNPQGYQPISYTSYYNSTSDLSITFSILDTGTDLWNYEERRELQTYRIDYKDGVAAILTKSLTLIDQNRLDQYYLPSGSSPGVITEGWFRIVSVLVNSSLANSAIMSFTNNFNYDRPNLVTFWFSSWQNDFQVKILGSCNLGNIKKVRTAVKTDNPQEAYLDVYMEFSGGGNAVYYSASNVIGVMRFLKDFQENPSTEGYTINEVSLIE